MSARVKCFFLEQIPGRNRYSLRRWASGGDKSICAKLGYHNASVVIGEGPPVEQSCSRNGEDSPVPTSDPRWPAKCDACDYRFTDGDFYQYNSDRLWRRTDTGEEMTLHEAGEGAMWYADWYSDTFKGPDGHCLVVRLRGGHDWIVDSRCSNCTLPKDNDHKCWPRNGTPPNVDVNKGHGRTCAAGAGSILIKGYHGFLRNGWLEEC